MTYKLSGPTGQMEMEKGAIGSHRSNGDKERCCRVPQVRWRWRKVPLGPIGRMEMEKGVVGPHKSDRERVHK